MDNNNNLDEKEPLITPNRMSIGGKITAMILILTAAILHIFTNLTFNMGDIINVAITLSVIGLPVDASKIIENVGKARSLKAKLD